MQQISSTLFIGHHIMHYASLESTNDFLKELIAAEKNKIPEGTLVIADEQTRGRGQNKNSWVSAKGENITASILLRPVFLNPMQIFFLNKAIAVSILETVAYYIPDVFIKWPNDIYAGNKKIGGILIENSLNRQQVQYAIAGIGININQQEFGDLIPDATSLAKISGAPYSIFDVLERLCGSIEKYYLKLRAAELEQIDSMYHQHLMWYGSEKEFMHNGIKIKGIIKRVDAEGKLVLMMEGKEEAFSKLEKA